jgi:hypothetical protein
MTQALAIEKVSLYELERKFGLELVNDPNFFREWQDDLPNLMIAERDRLQRVLAISANLERRSVLENTVKMARFAFVGFSRVLFASFLYGYGNGGGDFCGFGECDRPFWFAPSADRDLSL